MANNTAGATLSISPAREAQLRRAAIEMRNVLDRSDGELGRVRQVNQLLQEQIRSKSRGSAGTQFDPLSIQEFPNDILLEIFGHVCAIPPDDDDHGMPMALHLSQVCHRWREMALSNRILWRTFTSSASDEQKLVSLLQLYLTRSRGARLLFRIKNPPDEDPTDVTFYWQCAVMQHLAAEARRWGDASFDTFDAFFAPNPVGRLDGLKSLSLFHRPAFEGQVPQDMEFFSSAPQLRCLHILLYSLALGSCFRLPWHQLETIVFDVRSSFPAIFEALRSCRALRSLTVSHSRLPDVQEEQPEGNQGTVARSSSKGNLPITSLILAGTDAYERFLLPFAETFRCPDLISLTLKDTYASNNTPLVAFLRTVNPNLCKLDLGNISLSSPAISEALSLVPLLQELSCSFREQIPLSCFEFSQGLVLQLAVVNFAFWYRPDMDALARAFASRCVDARLDAMTVTYPAHPSNVGLRHIAWLREEAGEQYSFKWIDDRPLSTRTLRNPYVRMQPPPWLGFSLLKRGWRAPS
ncbi:hypothetical protein ARMSODRAFT_1020086 [Armillaria solidipes]|uniref:F-box domain-containing protein n=1 Tax=Armillaria solidipes TaxID=1076256 RepID=A0A2H3BTZ8_9AGAR|nr:hypothetical protein ARMSODRAFT_1020086 [Armillaria solidipes]